MNQPNPEKHQLVSFIKSFTRTVGYFLLFINIPTAACVLIVSEIIGILEELV